MAIQSIKRWQWIGISLIVGWGVGYVQQLPSSNWVKSFGDTITQTQFEEGLLKDRDGVRWFRNIVILPERIELDRGTRPVLIVTGDYFNGKLEIRDGQQCAIWKPRCYISEMRYTPMSVPAANVAKDATVLTYLDSLKSKGVSYTYAWWRDSRWAMSFWVGGSFAMIGLIWPTIVNLLAFGSFFRPREPKGTKLSNVVNRPPPPSRPEVTAQDLAAVEGMGAALEAELQSQATTVAAPEAEPPAKEEAVKQLAGTALGEAPADEHDAKAFGRGEGDFYPTERKAHVHCPTCGQEMGAGHEQCPKCGATSSVGARRE